MDKIFIYTDGSCSTSHKIGAWASIIFIESDKKILRGYAHATTHQRMELTAVIRSLEHILEHNLNSIPVTLYTDSQYVSGLHQRKEKLVSSNFITRKKTELPNSDLIQQFFSHSENMNLTIIKVKSHQLSSFEERINGEADKLCRNLVRKLVENVM